MEVKSLGCQPVSVNIRSILALIFNVLVAYLTEFGLKMLEKGTKPLRTMFAYGYGSL